MRRLIGELDGKAKWMGTVVLLLAMRATAQTVQATEARPMEAPRPTRLILVSIPDRKLALLEDDKVVKVYPVAVGKDSTPSPEGTFTIKSHVTNPTYYHEGKVVAPGPQNPLGSRWMGLSEKGYGIHGTNAPKSIGKAASHGCIRMAKKDLEELFTLVKVGDGVDIRGERDEQMAQVFGVEADATPATTVVAAIQNAPVAASAGGF
ncbi:ErfK/YbiS/YcfS/YnhG [Candidatus Koribacter versatilis Ellin345]|uniref:ErfK/YbiS/YcfS/YnhG n=1 Tax=Koribacter versatilis (strain Ellin345) TaxID=204669 RepID=Q1IQX0_KORVE|nr:L,D-transpeptidase [Candidatus Koribacter versatilis]ABF40730.1 ErfK/YbiS/YcfS/YnhG [Candidatus Koribacter versatilis Ellin345]